MAYYQNCLARASIQEEGGLEDSEDTYLQFRSANDSRPKFR